jgi:hypothetical protein
MSFINFPNLYAHCKWRSLYKANIFENNTLFNFIMCVVVSLQKYEVPR